MAAYQIAQTISDPGTAPARTDPDNFDARADAFLAVLSSWGTVTTGELIVWTSQVNALSTAVNGYSNTASAASLAAIAAVDATEWSNAVTYDAGDTVWGTDFLSYRSAQGSNTNHNPVGDGGTWWVLITGYVAGTAIAMADAVLSRAKLIDISETLNPLGDLGGGSDDIDLEDGNVVSATVSTAEETLTFSNPPASGSNGSFTLFLTNGGSQTVNWPASVDWPSATAPTLTAAGVDVLVFTTNDAGTTWLGFLVGLDIS
jgi:hypothetical protein